jgi:hypothetical protein
MVKNQHKASRKRAILVHRAALFVRGGMATGRPGVVTMLKNQPW